LHVGVGRRAVEIEVVFLDVLAVIALTVGDAEQTLLQDGIDAVPERQGEAESLPIVGDSGQAVLAPVIRARARLIVGEVVPRVAARAVVLAHGSPLTLGEIRTPLLPGGRGLAGLLETPSLFSHGRLLPLDHAAPRRVSGSAGWARRGALSALGDHVWLRVASASSAASRA